MLASDILKQGRSVIVDRLVITTRRSTRGWRLRTCMGSNISMWSVELRSPRSGVCLPPPDADAEGGGSNEDCHKLFERWIEHPCRPESDAIIVDSAASPEKCLDFVLKQILPSASGQSAECVASNFADS